MYIAIIVIAVLILVFALVWAIRAGVQEENRCLAKDEQRQLLEQENARLVVEYEADLRLFIDDESAHLDSQRWRELTRRHFDLDLSDYHPLRREAQVLIALAVTDEEFYSVFTHRNESVGEYLIKYADAKFKLRGDTRVTFEQRDFANKWMSVAGSAWLTNLLDTARTDELSYRELKQFLVALEYRGSAVGHNRVSDYDYCKQAGITFGDEREIYHLWYELLAQYEDAPLTMEFVGYRPQFVSGEFLAHMTQLIRAGRQRPLWEHKYALSLCHSSDGLTEYAQIAGSTREELQMLVTAMQSERQTS